MFPLRPVAAVAVNMQLRAGDPGEQAQPGVHRHEAVVASPDDQSWRSDLAEPRAKVRELLRVGFEALDEVVQMVAARQHIVQPRLEQRVSEVAGVKDENAHHLLQVFNGRLAVQGVQQLDALRRHRREQAHAAGPPAHQHQLSHPLRPAQGEGHCAVAAHRVAQQMDFIDPKLIDHAFQNAGVEIRTRAAVDDRIALPPPRTIEEQHAIARLDQRVNIAAEVGPAGSPRPGAVQHHHGLFPVAAVIDMDTQRAAPFVDVEESAGGGFGLRLIAHVSLPVNQISVVALSEPNPAIHSGIGR